MASALPATTLLMIAITLAKLKNSRAALDRHADVLEHAPPVVVAREQEEAGLVAGDAQV